MYSTLELATVIWMLAQPAAAAPDSSRALVTAMLGHDNSIRSMEWRQTYFFTPGVRDEAHEDASQCFDERGWWAFDNACINFAPLPDGSRPDMKQRLLYDGHAVTSVVDSNQSGIIKDYASERPFHSGIDCWLGRHLDLSGQERMGELLLAAPDLKAAGFSMRGLPVVSGTVALPPFVRLLEVEIDPEHGFAPRTITLRDRVLRVPYITYEVLGFTQVDGFWVPEHGRSAHRSRSPLKKEDRDKLTEALKGRGLGSRSDVSDPAVQRGYAAAIKEAFGTAEAPSQPMVPPREVEAVIESVNKPIDPARFRLALPREYTIFDSFRDLVKRPGSDEWGPNGGAPKAAAAPAAGGQAAAPPPQAPPVSPLPEVQGADAGLVKVIEDQPASVGPMKIGNVATRRVTIQNLTDRTLSLGVVSKSCPVIQVQFGSETLAPGASASVAVGMNVFESSGKQRHAAIIEAAERDAAGQVVRKQEARIDFVFWADVESVAFPGVLNLRGIAGEPAAFDVLVRRLDQNPILVERIVPPGDWVKIKDISTLKERPYQAVASLTCVGDQPGVLRGAIQDQVSGDVEPRSRVKLSLRVESPLLASPAAVVWREKGSEQGERSVIVRLARHPIATGDYKPVEARLEGGGGGMKVSSVAPGPDGTWEVTVSVDPAALPGDAASGVSNVKFMDDRGRVLCTVPVVWLREQALAPQ